MLTKERKQFSLFGDNWIYRRTLERFPDHPLVKLKPLVDKILKEMESEIETYYRKDFGRPSYPVGVIFKMLLLEYLYNLSDVAVSQAVFCNVLFRWFCGLDIDAAVPDDTTLVKFRARLGEDGFKEIFDAFIRQAKKLGYGKGKLRIIDATHVFSFSRGLNLAGLLKDGIRRVARRLKDKAVVLKEKTRQKAMRVIEAKGKVKLNELKNLIRQLSKELPGQVDETTGKLVNLLAKIAKGSKEKIRSLVDLDARWGYKNEDTPFFGYKAHLACDETGFVTSLEVLSGEKNEGGRLKEMIEQERKRGDKIEGVCADALYDSCKNREYLKSAGIKAYIPPKTEDIEIDKFTLEGEAVRCVAGKRSIGRIKQENGHLYYFSVRDCRGCSNYGRCVSPGEVRKKVYLSNCKILREEKYKERLGARKLIERLFGWGKRWLGLGRARYRGLIKVIIQVTMTFLAINLKIMIREPCWEAG